MTISPGPTATSSTDFRGVTLVEEDDVAFSLALGREITRLYACYLDGNLTGEVDLRIALDLSRQTISMLHSKVGAGMAALRLQVMDAQATEMWSVLFGGGRTVPAPVGRAPGRSPAAEPGKSRWPSLRRVGAGSARLMLGLVGCGVVAVAMDLPIAVMALFPSDLSMLGGIYVVAAGLAWAWHRRASRLLPTARP